VAYLRRLAVVFVVFLVLGFGVWGLQVNATVSSLSLILLVLVGIATQLLRMGKNTRLTNLFRQRIAKAS
jgi:hypothetical protein